MRNIALLTAILVLVFTAILAPTVHAADKVINAKIDTISQHIDKNGAPYTRIMILEPRELQGIRYETGIPVMAFGSLHEEASKLTPDTMFKAVVSERTYQGRTSYTLQALIQ